MNEKLLPIVNHGCNYLSILTYKLQPLTYMDDAQWCRFVWYSAELVEFWTRIFPPRNTPISWLWYGPEIGLWWMGVVGLDWWRTNRYWPQWHKSWGGLHAMRRREGEAGNPTTQWPRGDVVVNFKNMIFKLIIQNSRWCDSWEITQREMPLWNYSQGNATEAH